MDNETVEKMLRIEKIPSNIILISIQNWRDPTNLVLQNAKIRPEVLDNILCYFDNVKKHDLVNHELAITSDDAERIVEFVKRYPNTDIVVSCDDGVSRSAGVAAAISYALTGNDLEFFRHPYCPNLRCYKYVLNAFGIRPDKEHILSRDRIIKKVIKEQLKNL